MSVTTTAKLQLEKVVAGSAEPWNNGLRINDNMQTIDDELPPKVVTSATRPASPWNGMLIWETDTRTLRAWNAGTSEWVHVGGIDASNILKIKLRTTGGGTTSGTTELSVVTSDAAALVSGDKYQLDFYCRYSSDAASHFTLRVREDTTISGTVIGQNVETRAIDLIGAGYKDICTVFFTAAATGNKQFNGTIVRQSGTGNATVSAGTFLRVSRIGSGVLTTI